MTRIFAVLFLILFPCTILHSSEPIRYVPRDIGTVNNISIICGISGTGELYGGVSTSFEIFWHYCKWTENNGWWIDGGPGMILAESGNYTLYEVGHGYTLNNRILSAINGPPQSGHYTRAWDLNSMGYVLGEAEDGYGIRYFVIWGIPGPYDSPSKLIDLGADFSSPNALNDSCQIAGISNGHTCVWTPNVGMRILASLPNETTSWPYDINNLGQAVGYSKSTDGSLTAVLWSADGTIIDLGPGSATRINNQGQVLISDPSSSVDFIWSANTGRIPLPPLPNNTVSGVAQINDRGQIVGTSGSHIVLWERAYPIGQARGLASGSRVLIDDAVVIGDNALQAGSVFVESASRCSGLKIITDNTYSIGQRLQFTGNINYTDGEWQVNIASMLSSSTGDSIAPVGVTSRIIGCDRKETLQFTGLNTVGVLVRLCGSVSAVISAQTVFYVDDGLHYQDGLGPFYGIRVKVPAGVVIPGKNKRVAVTGISRITKYTLDDWGEVNGDWYPPGSTVYVPEIWVRSADDIREF